ncbi:MAG: DUF2911 domain-containing protein [Cyclobacteriaceae bacterium]
MKKIFKIFAIIIASILVLGFAGYQYVIYSTKQHSPEDIVQYQKGNYDLEVFYNRPYKKGREIFGSLEPYGQVWRTGANEATTFETKSDLTIGGSLLNAGKYTLWTIPGPQSWKVIFNDKQYDWGVGRNGASREAEYDALTVDVPVESTADIIEQFTIAFEDEGGNPTLTLSWDETKISVPIQ